MNAPVAEATPSRIHAWLAARTPWQRRGLAILAGAAATLGHAPFQLTLVYVAAIVAFVWLLDIASAKPKRLRSGFFTAFFFGLGHLTTGLYWVSAAFNVDSSAWGPVWGIPATLGLAAGLSVFFGLGGVLAMALWTRDVRRVAAFALAFFASEWLPRHAFGGFPWLLPGYVWTPGEPVSQLASLIGIYGLTLLTLLVAAAPAAIADRGASAGKRFAPLVVAGLIVGLGFGWGAQRLARASVDAPGALPVVSVADSGISQAEKWANRPDQEWRVLTRYLDASGSPDDSRADIVVWPEGAIPTLNFWMLEDQNFLNAIGRGMGDRVLITGLTRRELQNDRIAYFNSAVVIDGVTGQPRVGQTYDKRRLVPFGEFIPLWNLIAGFNIAPLQRIGAGFDAGAEPTRLIIPRRAAGRGADLLRSDFPGHGRQDGDESSRLDRDGHERCVVWWRLGPVPTLRNGADIARLRRGCPIARAASGGISAIVDSYGREVAATNCEGGVLFAQAQLPHLLSRKPHMGAMWGSISARSYCLPLILGFRFIPAGSPRPGRESCSDE